MKRFLTVTFAGLLLATQYHFLHAQEKRRGTLIGSHLNAGWLQVSPNGRWLVSGGSPEVPSTTNRLWDLRNSRWRQGNVDSFANYLGTGHIAMIAAQGDDTVRLQGGADNDVPPVVRIVRPPGSTGRLFRDSFPPLDRFFDCHNDPSGRRLVVLSAYFIRHFNLKTGTLIKRVPWNYNRENRAEDGWRGMSKLSNDGRFILTLGDHPRIYDASSGRLLRTYPGRIGFQWVTARIFALGREAKLPTGETEYITEFHDLRHPHRLWVMKDGLSYESQVTPKSNIIKATTHWWTIRDGRTGKIIRQFPCPIGTDDVYALTPDERSIYILKPDGTIWKQRLPR